MNPRSISRVSVRPIPFLVLLVLLALPGLLATGCASTRYSPAASVPSDPEFGARLNALAKAYETMDVNKITPFYAPDGYELSFDTPFPFSTGAGEHSQVLAGLLAKVSTLSVALAPQFEVWRDGDRAWTIRRFKATGVAKTGESFTYEGWHSVVWEKRAGTWLVWYEHFGGGPAAAAAALAKTPPPAPAPPVVPPPPQLKVGDVFFDLNRWDIRVDQVAMLENDVKFLQEYPELKIVIEGHCDERGGESYNDGLGEKRAQAVKAYLVAQGIAAERLQTISFGKRKPFELGKGEQIWQLNRRAHFVVVQ
jgi:peptidoglycan-associated lipoprotein